MKKVSSELEVFDSSSQATSEAQNRRITRGNQTQTKKTPKAITKKTNETFKTKQKNIGQQKNWQRQQWQPEEDIQVVRLVRKYGANWRRLENEMETRSGKQIRERWINHLDPQIRWVNFTSEEDQIILQFHSKLGPRWREISKQLVGRPENMVKNRFHTVVKHMAKVHQKVQIELPDERKSCSDEDLKNQNKSDAMEEDLKEIQFTVKEEKDSSISNYMLFESQSDLTSNQLEKYDAACCCHLCRNCFGELLTPLERSSQQFQASAFFDENLTSHIKMLL